MNLLGFAQEKVVKLSTVFGFEVQSMDLQKKNEKKMYIHVLFSGR